VWWRKAADQGNVLAQVNLGLLYERGRGIPQDYERAHMWFNLAASRAEDAETLNFAVKNRDALAAKMTPAQIAEAQRMAREWVPK
jgi:TPR repeat protein